MSRNSDPQCDDDSEAEFVQSLHDALTEDLSAIEAVVAYDNDDEPDTVLSRLLWFAAKVLSRSHSSITSADTAIAHSALHDWLTNSQGVARYVEAQSNAALLDGPS